MISRSTSWNAGAGPEADPKRPDHSIEDECADLAAIVAATGATAAFGHSFGGLVVLEAARRLPIFSEVFVYEPGVPIRGQLRHSWLDDYQGRLEHGDRSGALASMVKRAGFAPKAVSIMPVWYLRSVLRIAIRGQKRATMDSLLEANLVEHRLQARLDAPTPERFSTISARTLLFGGTKSPDSISGLLLDELAASIPSSHTAVLPGLGHLAPQEQADQIATAILSQHRPIR